jgi:hypothetical protein
MVTATDIVNQAIQLMGDNQQLVTGNYPSFDNSPAGVAASQLYGPCVQTVMKNFTWDFGRNNAALVVTVNVAPFPWSQEYLYPSDGLTILQVRSNTLSDPNNPAPVEWTIGNVLVSSIPKKVIWTNLASAWAVYTNFPPPDVWDVGFREAVVRLLASELAMAIPGKPDVSEKTLESAGAFETAGEARPG